jgi:demethylmenaquinone methyltransferase/2-methoxy-6-polyprenyl-1,4-benzoquinol methylase
MLRRGREKGAPEALVADALELPFPDGSFDAATIAFGIRNVSDPARVIREMARVVRANGRVVVLEFSAPRFAPIRFVHGLWLRFAVPLIGRIVSGRGEAYRYLSRSVASFSVRVDLASVFRGAGLAVVERRPLTLGAVEMLVGRKTS